MVDALVLGTSIKRCVGSSPTSPTTNNIAIMMNFKSRRESILSTFEKVKEELQQLNNDIEAQILANKDKIQELQKANAGLVNLKSGNSASISAFSKLIK